MNKSSPTLAIILTLLCHTVLSSALAAQEAPTAWGQWTEWGDQGDGTYRNPVLPADYSDIDCIRVGSDYYAISSTFQFSPGVVILHSRDLVNWRILGHVVSDVTQIGPEMNWDRMSRYGNGIWAGSIRHHAGRFRVYFGTPDEGFFMSTAKDPAGPWEPLHQLMKSPGWDDCCPFWDDDGQGYFVCSQFAKDPNNGRKYNIHLFKLSADGRDLVMESDKIIHQSNGSEANKLYKINGTYYHYYSEVRSEGRVVMMNRSKNIYGPYETKQLNHTTKLDYGPNQGGLVQTENGDWHFFTHHGRGDWAGRQASLLPVNWVDGWPILGAVGPDGIGNMVWSGKKPVTGFPITLPQTSDEFASPKLEPQWEWNYQPRADKWSLSERPGFIRLHAFKTLGGDNLRKVGNILTQRSFRAQDNVVVVKLELEGMADGQHAGLCHFSVDSSLIGVVQSGNIRTLEFSYKGKQTTGPTIESPTLWLKSTWGLDGLGQFSYSTDGKVFTPFGEPAPLAWGAYRGDRIGLFTYNNKSETGYVDIDWLHYTFKSGALK